MKNNGMGKSRIFGTKAMAISAVMVICAGGATFAAVNNAMLSNEMNKTVTVAAVTGLPNVAAADKSADTLDFTNADYTVTVETGGAANFPEAAMTAQESADIAAKYLWEVFDYSPKGKEFYMSPQTEILNFSLRGKEYSQYAEINPLNERAVWNGDVSNAAEELCFMFSMDAITGEIVSAHLEDLSDTEVAIRQFSDPDTAKFWNDNREEYLSLAKDIAEKHLGTKIVSAKFEATIAIGIPVSDEIATALEQGLPLTPEMLKARMTVNEVGETVQLVAHNIFDIRVADENGKEIIVSITNDTKELYEIYNADAIAQVDLERNAELRAELGYM